MTESDNKIDITPLTLLDDLFNSYPQAADILIEISPVFIKLKNPELRKTVAKAANLKQAALIGNVTIGDLINKLRSAAGLNEIQIKSENKMENIKPEWVNENSVKTTYDASIDLENGIHPAGKVTKEILELTEDEIYLLITPFVPAPLLKIAEEKGFKYFSEKMPTGEVKNYIKRK